MPIEPCDEPLTVTAEDGYVFLEGGCGVSVTLTPFAATDSGDDLMNKAAVALGQQRMALLAKSMFNP